MGGAADRAKETDWGNSGQAIWPWQCLYFLPEPHGQGSLRPTLPHDDGFLGSRFAEGGVASGICGTSSSPVTGSTWCACIGGASGCGGWLMISTRINCDATVSRNLFKSVSKSWKASDLYSFSGSRWP